MSNSMLRKRKSLRPKAATSSVTPGLRWPLSHTLTYRPAPSSRREVRMCTVRPFPLPVASLSVAAPPTAGAVVSGSAQERPERFWPWLLWPSHFSKRSCDCLGRWGRYLPIKFYCFKAGRIGLGPSAFPLLVVRRSSRLQATSFRTPWRGAAAAGRV